MTKAATRDHVEELERVVVRQARRADVPQMLELVRTALGEGSVPRTAVFWRWKHEQNPFGPSPAMIAEADGQVVSLRVFLRWRWRYEERTLAAVRPVDTATHPEWRRRGLFERLTRELVAAMRAEGVAFLFNTPNTRSGQGYRKLGWDIVGRPSIWVRPVKPVRLLREFARRGGPRGGGASPHPKGSTSLALLDAPDVSAFLGRCRPSGSRLVTDLSAAYLRWRYRDCPGLCYQAVGDFDRTSGALVIVRAVVRPGVRELRLCDLFVSQDKASRRKARHVMRILLREHDADLVTARAVPGRADAGVLQRSGFLPVPRIGPVLAARPLTRHSDLPAIDGLSIWGVSIGDMEVF